MGKMVFNLVSWGMDSVLTGIGNIFGDKDPGQTHLEKAFEGMFGVFKIIGGMASFWLASRMLMPWKLLSDVKAMKLLGSALTIAEKPQPGPPKPVPEPTRGLATRGLVPTKTRCSYYLFYYVVLISKCFTCIFHILLCSWTRRQKTTTMILKSLMCF